MYYTGSSINTSIYPNRYNKFGEVTSLTLSFSELDDNGINEFLFEFTSGATATTLILPSTIKWMSEPDIQANKTYQVSVVSNLGIIAEF